MIEMIRELIYNSKRNLYEIFRENVRGDLMEVTGFIQMCKRYSNKALDPASAESAFQMLCKKYESPEQLNKDYLTFQEFHSAIQMVIPNPEQFEDEQKILLIIKEWLASRFYSSGDGFELLLRSVNRVAEGTLRRYDIHKAVISQNILLTAPEIDYLFDTLTGFKMVPNTLLSLHQWQKKVLDEKGNPLQVLRTLVKK